MSNYRIETKCVQSGYEPGNGEPRVLPIYQSTTFRYTSSEQMGRLFDLEESGYFYTRLQNPTNDAVAAKICDLEGGAAAMLTSSGQAANFYAIMNIAEEGDHIVCASALYGGTYNLFAHTIRKMGVIIGETTIIGDNVTLYQGVTLGGTGKEQGKRHPTLKDNVMVSAGAKVIGSFTIGENSKIGAGSVVLEEVPPNCTVVGVPGRIVKMDNKKVPRSDMDQIHLPDPVLNDIRELQQENIQLHKQLEDMVEYMKCLEKKRKEDAANEDL